MKATNRLEEHAQKLCEALRGHPLEALITLALATGMRRDELFTLCWQDIDREEGSVCIWNTKTKGSSRIIHVSEEILSVLTQHQMRQMEAQLEAGSDWHNLDLVFSDAVGERLRPHSFFKASRAVFTDVGLPSLCFHDLRCLVAQRRYQQFRQDRDGVQEYVGP